MASVISIALSGLQAATRRVGVSANNIANALTSRPATESGGGFRAQRVVAQSSGGGGVTTTVTDKSPATAPDLAGGTAVFANVNLAEEAVEQTQAIASYRANAAVIRAQQALDDALLDVKI